MLSNVERIHRFSLLLSPTTIVGTFHCRTFCYLVSRHFMREKIVVSTSNQEAALFQYCEMYADTWTELYLVGERTLHMSQYLIASQNH